MIDKCPERSSALKRFFKHPGGVSSCTCTCTSRNLKYNASPVCHRLSCEIKERERERERERVSEREREWVCVRESERERECVCVREREITNVDVNFPRDGAVLSCPRR